MIFKVLQFSMSKVFKNSKKVLCQIPLEKTFTYTGLLHPPTYENKVIVSTLNGDMIMFNVKTSKKIFTFKSAQNHKINVMVKTPHLHVIGGKFYFSESRFIFDDLPKTFDSPK